MAETAKQQMWISDRGDLIGRAFGTKDPKTGRPAVYPLRALDPDQVRLAALAPAWEAFTGGTGDDEATRKAVKEYQTLLAKVDMEQKATDHLVSTNHPSWQKAVAEYNAGLELSDPQFYPRIEHMIKKGGPIAPGKLNPLAGRGSVDQENAGRGGSGFEDFIHSAGKIATAYVIGQGFFDAAGALINGPSAAADAQAAAAGLPQGATIPAEAAQAAGGGLTQAQLGGAVMSPEYIAPAIATAGTGAAVPGVSDFLTGAKDFLSTPAGAMMAGAVTAPLVNKISPQDAPTTSMTQATSYTPQEQAIREQQLSEASRLYAGMIEPGSPEEKQLREIQEAQTYGLTGAMDVKNNPYLQGAMEAAIRPVEQKFSEVLLPQIRSESLQAGQYGGTRQGLAEGLAASRAAQTMGDITSQMGSRAYETGQQTFSNVLGMTPQLQQAPWAPLKGYEATTQAIKTPTVKTTTTGAKPGSNILGDAAAGALLANQFFKLAQG